jgi:hypothetical protein
VLLWGCLSDAQNQSSSALVIFLSVFDFHIRPWSYHATRIPTTPEHALLPSRHPSKSTDVAIARRRDGNTHCNHLQQVPRTLLALSALMKIVVRRLVEQLTRLSASYAPTVQPLRIAHGSPIVYTIHSIIHRVSPFNILPLNVS